MALPRAIQRTFGNLMGPLAGDDIGLMLALQRSQQLQGEQASAVGEGFATFLDTPAGAQTLANSIINVRGGATSDPFLDSIRRYTELQASIGTGSMADVFGGPESVGTSFGGGSFEGLGIGTGSGGTSPSGTSPSPSGASTAASGGVDVTSLQDAVQAIELDNIVGPVSTMAGLLGTAFGVPGLGVPGILSTVNAFDKARGVTGDELTLGDFFLSIANPGGLFGPTPEEVMEEALDKLSLAVGGPLGIIQDLGVEEIPGPTPVDEAFIDPFSFSFDPSAMGMGDDSSLSSAAMAAQAAQEAAMGVGEGGVVGPGDVGMSAHDFSMALDEASMAATGEHTSNPGGIGGV